MTIAIIIFGLIMSIGGLVGCLLPIIPGPPLSFLALLILSFAKNWEPFSVGFLIFMGILTALALTLDYAVPVAGSKRFGASKYGIWGSILGMLIGLFVFPPFGLFVGGFSGAIVGELYAGKAGNAAFRAGFGVFLGSLASIAFKLALCGLMLFFFLVEMF